MSSGLTPGRELPRGDNHNINDALTTLRKDMPKDEDDAKPITRLISDAESDTRLRQLQSKGLGKDVSFGVSGQHIAAPTEADHKQLESTLRKIDTNGQGTTTDASDQKSKSADPTTLNIAKTNGDDDFDEIFIDVRGNLHHATPGLDDEELNVVQAVPVVTATSTPHVAPVTVPQPTVSNQSAPPVSPISSVANQPGK